MGFTLNYLIQQDNYKLLLYFSPQNVRYYEIVKQPICLDQIREKLAGSRYKSVVEFVSDIKLMFNNYYLYHAVSVSFHNVICNNNCCFISNS